MAYLLLSAASYDGEILHADVLTICRACAGFYVYRGRRYENTKITTLFHKYVQIGLQFCCDESPQATGQSVGWTGLYAVGLYQAAGWLAAAARWASATKSLIHDSSPVCIPKAKQVV